MPVVSGLLLRFGLNVRLIVLHHVAQPVFRHLRDDCALRSSKKTQRMNSYLNITGWELQTR